MNVLSIFTGTGGIDLGLERAGHRIVAQCEADPWRRQVLAHRWPGITIHDDVTTLDTSVYAGTHADGRRDGGGDLRGTTGSERAAGAERQQDAAIGRHGDQPSGQGGRGTAGNRHGRKPESRVRRVESQLPVDLVAGGFPCQDVSVAGRRAGLAGQRSGLFYVAAGIVDAVRPGWVLIENVPGLLTSNGGRDFGAVLGTLADIGYCVAWRVVDSRYFGVPQRRRRVFILGTVAGDDPDGARARAGAVLAVGESCRRHPPQGRQTGPHVAVASLSGLGNGGPDDNDGQAGRLVTHALTSAGHDASEDGTGRGTPIVVGPLLSGKSSGWRGDDHEAATGQYVVADTLTSGSHPNSNRVGDRVRRLTPVECERLQGFPDDWTLTPNVKSPDSRRYAAMGDAVTVNVAHWIGQRLNHRLINPREAGE